MTPDYRTRYEEELTALFRALQYMAERSRQPPKKGAVADSVRFLMKLVGPAFHPDLATLERLPPGGVPPCMDCTPEGIHE